MTPQNIREDYPEDNEESLSYPEKISVVNIFFALSERNFITFGFAS